MADGYGSAGPPPAKQSGRKVGLVIGLVGVLLLCPCLGLAGWGSGRPPTTRTRRVPANSTPATRRAGRRGARRGAEPGTHLRQAEPHQAEPQRKYLAKGDCVVNDGTAADAELRKVPCGPNTYEVLLRIPRLERGPVQDPAPKATANYVHDNPLDSLDYVLCLRSAIA